MIGASTLVTTIVNSTTHACAHCGERLGRSVGTDFCCQGCEAAHGVIAGAGLGVFYRRLERARAHRPMPLDVNFTDFANCVGPAEFEIDVLLGGLDCAACVWLVESLLAREPTVTRARANLSTRRVSLRWRGNLDDANRHVGLIASLGFKPVPYRSQAAAHDDTRDARNLLRCLAVAGFAAANVMLLSVAIWAGHDGSMGDATRTLFHWLSASIALPAVAYAGRPFFSSACTALRGGRTNMDVPVSVGVLLACTISIHETWIGETHAFFDSAVTLLFFLLIGRYLDRRARGRARESVRALLALASRSATVLGADGISTSRPVDRLRVDDVLLVAAGERIGADGTVCDGSSSVDTALISGESLPIAVGPGAPVFAGMLNLGVAIRVRVTAAGERTLLSEIVRLIEAAERGRSRYVALTDRVARVYAPIVHVTALATFLGWMTVGGLAWDRALVIATAVLIITCPCALALAVPVVHVVASTRLLRAGVLLLSPTALERFARIDHVVLDKTGTITLGRPELVDSTGNREALRLAAGIAASSRHPLAQALVRAAPEVQPASGVVEQAGLGLQRDTIRVGSAAFCGVADAIDDNRLELWLAQPSQRPVRFSFVDRLRPDVASTLGILQRAGLPIELLSGDRQAAVAQAAAEAGGLPWLASVSPAAKVDRLAALASQGKRVLMIGDGLNDAPALAAAHASISPATAAEATQNAADAVFQGDSFRPVAETVSVAQFADRLVRQNLALALLYNLSAVPLAIFGTVTPLIAAIAMSSSSLLVIGNALRLGRCNRTERNRDG